MMISDWVLNFETLSMLGVRPWRWPKLTRPFLFAEFNRCRWRKTPCCPWSYTTSAQISKPPWPRRTDGKLIETSKRMVGTMASKPGSSTTIPRKKGQTVFYFFFNLKKFSEVWSFGKKSELQLIVVTHFPGTSVKQVAVGLFSIPRWSRWSYPNFSKPQSC